MSMASGKKFLKSKSQQIKGVSMSKLKWGMIGGGEGSQIGPAHRLGAGLDGLFEFAAGALDHRPDAGRDYGQAPWSRRRSRLW